MTPKLTQTTTLVRLLSVAGALSFPMAMASTEAADLPVVDLGLSSRAEEPLAKTLTHIDVQQGIDDVRVVISGMASSPIV